MGIIRDIRDLIRDYKKGYTEDDIDKRFEQWDKEDDERLRYYQ